MTPGVLLRKLSSDADLREFSHVMIDEARFCFGGGCCGCCGGLSYSIFTRCIDTPTHTSQIILHFHHQVHERDRNTDFLLIVLRDLIATRRPDLKLILMSATLQVRLGAVV